MLCNNPFLFPPRHQQSNINDNANTNNTNTNTTNNTTTNNDNGNTTTNYNTNTNNTQKEIQKQNTLRRLEENKKNNPITQTTLAPIIQNIKEGKREFLCATSYERLIIHLAAKECKMRSEVMVKTDKIQFSCKDWAVKSNIHWLFKNKRKLCQDMGYYIQHYNIYSCEEEDQYGDFHSLCDDIPEKLKKNCEGLNYDDDQSIYFFYYTHRVGVRVMDMDVIVKNKKRPKQKRKVPSRW